LLFRMIDMRFAAALALSAVSLLGGCASLLPGRAPPQGYATSLALWTGGGDCDFARPDRARLRAAATSRDYVRPAREGSDSTYVVREAEAHGRLLRGTYCLSVARGPIGAEPTSTYGFTVSVGGRNSETLEVKPAYASARTRDGTPLRVHISLGAAPTAGGVNGPETLAAFDLGSIPGDGVAQEPDAPARNLRWPRDAADALRLVAVVQESTNPDAPGPVPPELVREALLGSGD
jgi:hypothetical protein